MVANCVSRSSVDSFFSTAYLDGEVMRLLDNWPMDYSLRVVFSLGLMEENLIDFTWQTFFCGSGEVTI